MDVAHGSGGNDGGGGGGGGGVGVGVGVGSSANQAQSAQGSRQEPVRDDNGEEQLPVIFVVAVDGTTIDVGVQADVTAATIDWATVRFADQVADTFDSGLDGEPVRNDGSMLLIGPMPDPANSIELGLVRYYAVDDGESFTLQITSDTTTADTDNSTPRASVTAVTQP